MGKEAKYLFLDPFQAPFAIHDGVNVILKGDLLSGMFEGQSRQPPPVSHFPSRSAPVLTAMAQQKSLKMLTRACHDLPDRAAQTNQVAHRLVVGVRNPNGCQFSGAMETSEHRGVATVRLHSIARPLRNQ